MHRYVFFLCFAFALAADLSAQQPEGFLSSPPEPNRNVYKWLTASETRTVIALNGGWEASFDDGDSWTPVAIPSCYDESDKFLLRKTFSVPDQLADRYRWRLTGYGVQYSGSFSLNGSFIVQREGMIPFSAPVPDEIKVGSSNVLVVEVDSRLDYASTVPGRRLPLDVRTYGGVVRDLFLVGVPRVSIDDVRIDRMDETDITFGIDVVSGAIKGMQTAGSVDTSGGGRISLRQSSADFDVSLRVAASSTVGDSVQSGGVDGGSASIRLESHRTGSVSLSIGTGALRRWSPDRPVLYEAVVQVRHKGRLVDERRVSFGYRTTGTASGAVTLNGEPVALQGIGYVEDVQEYGASLPYSRMREDLEEIRDLGVNLIRFSSGAPHPYLLELCDQLGLMVFVDIPIGTPAPFLYGTDGFLERALDRTRATIQATRAYSSVVGYGVGFPFAVQPEAAAPFLRKLDRAIDSLAPDRLYYVVANEWSNADVIADVDIAGVSGLDVSAANLVSIVKSAQQAVGDKKPVMLMAFGRLVRIGNQNGYSDTTSTQAQAKYIGDVLDAVSSLGIAGTVYWSYNDYRSDRPLLTVHNDDMYVVSCGLTTLDRQMRISGKTLRALYTNQKPPDLAIGEYSPPSTIFFIVIGILCAVVFLLLINNSRRFRENVFRALLRPYNFYADIRDQRILSTVQTSLLGLVIATTFAVLIASICYYYRMNESFDFVLSAAVTADWAKEMIVFLVWKPLLAVFAFTLVIFGMLLLVGGVIRLGSIAVRNRIFFSDAYTIAVWGALPVLLLIPLAMILYRVLELPSAGIVAFALVLAVIVWIAYRVLRGTAVVYDVRASRVYGYSIGTVVVVAIILLITSDNVYAMFSYVRDGIGSLYGL